MNAWNCLLEESILSDKSWVAKPPSPIPKGKRSFSMWPAHWEPTQQLMRFSTVLFEDQVLRKTVQLSWSSQVIFWMYQLKCVPWSSSVPWHLAWCLLIVGIHCLLNKWMHEWHYLYKMHPASSPSFIQLILLLNKHSGNIYWICPLCQALGAHKMRHSSHSLWNK